MISYIKGDLFSTNCDVIAHGCNCCGVMKSGVAKLVREKYPWAYTKYEEHYKHCVIYHGHPPRPGTVVAAQQGAMHVLNLLTQKSYGRDPNQRYVSYDAVDECFKYVASYMRNYGLYEIAIPKIGAGLGNGYWPTIESIIHDKMFGLEVNVYTTD